MSHWALNHRRQQVPGASGTARRRCLQLGAGLALLGLHAGLRAQSADAAELAEADLPRAFAAVRRLRGHFDGAPWNDAVDRYNGHKHVLMQRLAGMLLRERAGTARVRSAMGRPDSRVEPGSAAHAALRERATPPGLPAEATLWLYRWRATHDQLLLAFVRERLVAVVWLLDGE